MELGERPIRRRNKRLGKTLLSPDQASSAIASWNRHFAMRSRSARDSTLSGGIVQPLEIGPSDGARSALRRVCGELPKRIASVVALHCCLEAMNSSRRIALMAKPCSS